jgi:Ca2+-binding RTX toxin-like protein
VGNDTLIGGLGDDQYNVDSTGDVATEAAGEGIDRLFTTVTYTLGANVENLTMLGAAAIDGTGNGEDNTIVGNTANNVLTGLGGNDMINGLGGNDTMIGGVGNDTYFVDAALDVVTEAAGEGVDRVNAGVTYTLSANVENLTLTGASAIDGAGNALDNALIGNTGANVLDGAGGNDLMNGGAGNDTLVYDAADTNVQGGADTDTLRIAGAGVAVNLTLVPDNVFRDIEIIDLTGTGANSLTLALNDVLLISSTTDTLRVDGNLGDLLTATDAASWATGADVVIGANTYHTYTQGAAMLLVDTDIVSNL